ncbi:MAG TPA: 1,4-dihydroxy-6-naphthoate synthase [Vicinamibacteria bacterium]|jgi:1,4-dihydroxy-6-naphthoate synthase
MSEPLAIGFSPCPNDTFMFHALVAGQVEVPGFAVTSWLADIEALNERALGPDPLAVTKLSVHGFAYVADRYRLLRAGAALGRGCGPLVVARTGGDLGRLAGRRVAIPGQYTTAHLLLRMFAPPTIEVVPMRFDAIMPAVAAGEVDAGAIIHEGRFTYAGHGLVEVADLGTLWEAETRLPLPLGVIAVRRALGSPLAAVLEDRLRASIAAAQARPEASAAYVREHSQEMDPEVCRRHIALYVNDYSLELGPEGEAAIAELLARGAAAGILPRGTGQDPW